jgi:hypothetical protein
MARPGLRGATSAWLVRPRWASGSFAPALCRHVGLRDHSADRRVHQVRYARVLRVHHGLPRRAWSRLAPHWQAAWFAVARSEQASGPVLLQPVVARPSMERRARRLAAQEASVLLEESGAAAQVRLAARLEALRATVASPALAARPRAERHAAAEQAGQQRAESARSFAALHEAVERAASEHLMALDESVRRLEAVLSVVARPRPRPVRPALKPARVGPARIARVTAAASTTRQ